MDRIYKTMMMEKILRQQFELQEKLLRQKFELHNNNKKTGILSKTEKNLHNCVSTDLDVAINRKLPSNYIK